MSWIHTIESRLAAEVELIAWRNQLGSATSAQAILHWLADGLHMRLLVPLPGYTAVMFCARPGLLSFAAPGSCRAAKTGLNL